MTMTQSDNPPAQTPTPSERNAWLFLTELSNNIDMRERVYRQFKRLTPGNWTGFAALGAAEGYSFTGAQLKVVLPDTFYADQREPWRTAADITVEPVPAPDAPAEVHPIGADQPVEAAAAAMPANRDAAAPPAAGDSAEPSAGANQLEEAGAATRPANRDAAAPSAAGDSAEPPARIDRQTEGRRPERWSRRRFNRDENDPSLDSPGE